jgi:hypothetical protein
MLICFGLCLVSFVRKREPSATGQVRLASLLLDRCGLAELMRVVFEDSKYALFKTGSVFRAGLIGRGPCLRALLLSRVSNAVAHCLI